MGTGSVTRLKTHTLRFQAQWVDGMLKTRVTPCGQPRGVAHPAQKNLDVTKPRLTVGVATALPMVFSSTGSFDLVEI
jgi:hypothetical protein